MSGGCDAGVTTRFLRFDPGSGRDEVVTHDFWEEIYIVSGTFESGGRAYLHGSDVPSRIHVPEAASARDR